jgi:hypothetical protein
VLWVVWQAMPMDVSDCLKLQRSKRLLLTTAKERHVGHLRSTIIGDTLYNVLAFAGHDIVSCQTEPYWRLVGGINLECWSNTWEMSIQLIELWDMDELYKAVKKWFDADADADADFKVWAHTGVFKLQARNAEELATWEALCVASQVEYQKVRKLMWMRQIDSLLDDADLLLIHNLVCLPDILNEVERGLYPNQMCNYLFERSQKFNKVFGIYACSIVSLMYYEIDHCSFFCFYLSFMKAAPWRCWESKLWKGYSHIINFYLTIHWISL